MDKKFLIVVIIAILVIIVIWMAARPPVEEPIDVLPPPVPLDQPPLPPEPLPEEFEVEVPGPIQVPLPEIPAY